MGEAGQRDKASRYECAVEVVYLSLAALRSVLLFEIALEADLGLVAW